MPLHAIRLESQQRATLTPRLQQAVRLLQLSSLDFAREIQHALNQNPFLEDEEPDASTDREDQVHAPGGDQPAPAEVQHAVDTASHPEHDVAWPDGTISPQSGASSGKRLNDADFSYLDTVAQETSLRQHLHSQASVRRLQERQRALVGLIIESIDDDGYLRMDVHDLATVAELDPVADPEEINAAIAVVQSMEPCGVAARSLQECLDLQLEAMADPARRAMARTIIREHVDLLARKDLGTLSRLLGTDVGEIQAICERIRHLDPHPGWQYGAEPTRYLTPDLIARKVKGQWQLSLNPDVVPRVRVSEIYTELFQQHKSAEHGELAAHLQEARWTVRNVNQRFQTILAVATAILRRQHLFLEFGPMALKPLALKELADELDLHESTISRAINNKYMATPAGVFELKQFFSRAMYTANGGTCSTAAIQGLIREMIDEEDAGRPLSDAEITRLLARQGLVVARRTVTKYRQMMKIAAVSQRRAPASSNLAPAPRP
ncbi:MAG TPA: RNA polymerase factor sigma-54 [Aquabacterium sp.]|uniref:RNA polymerase factor sigma-54 n=1 Tax=Aquabacterium sp. TaxID=1872578 RepID=UPI002E3710F8|nr:RNA polymerase factor sigma-54 [Aquabacterium sp.]HEX5357941.1 RNA polymerase factor sigma-54 [Aquabacterium sp.]